jgi:hypothetical protein
MALRMRIDRSLLAFGALWSMSVLFSAPLLAQSTDDEPKPSPRPSPSSTPNLTLCNDQDVQHMANGVKALDGIVTVYRSKLAKSGNKKPGQSAAAYAVRYRKTVDSLWRSMPDCSENSKRGDLTAEGFVLYMTTMLQEAYDSAVLQLGAGRFHEARFYIDGWYQLHRDVHDEAVGEGWASWRDLDAELLPSVHALHLRVCKLEERYCI